jgi:hypothetical protein
VLNAIESIIIWTRWLVNTAVPRVPAGCGGDTTGKFCVVLASAGSAFGIVISAVMIRQQSGHPDDRDCEAH